jgi:hypothetical protein
MLAASAQSRHFKGNPNQQLPIYQYCEYGHPRIPGAYLFRYIGRQMDSPKNTAPSSSSAPDSNMRDK